MSLVMIPMREEYVVWQPPLSHAVDLSAFNDCEFYTVSKTAEELSIICPVDRLPANASGKIEQPWNGFRVAGQLDFSLVGIMAQISGILAEHKISLFAVSTFDTDYILVKKDKFEAAKQALATKFEVV